MYYHIVVTLLLLVFLTNLLLNLRFLRKPDPKRNVSQDPAPLISVLVPARNEAANIEECANSLCAQDYPNFEILVLDDNSTDDTGAIVQRIAARNQKVRLLRGVQLPPGWIGKPFACHQLAQEAKGEWLLFTDADTWHAPHALRGALGHALEHKLSLVSGWPHQRCTSIIQHTVVPVFIFMILSLFPLWLARLQRQPSFGLTVGQFVFINARDYWKIGGHEAVKARILEDMWLGFNAASNGLRQEALNLSNTVSTRMYQRADQLWEGFTKWVYAIASMAPLGLAMVLVIAFCVFIAPAIWLIWQWTPIPSPVPWSVQIGVQLVLIALMRAMVDWQFRSPLQYLLTHPLGIGFMALSCLYAYVRHLTGAGVAWKGRVYEAEGEASATVEDEVGPTAEVGQRPRHVP